jgi:diguanylate cyclase (GGDEF)-like protein/PAS domain S-box-containing protein
MDKNNFSQLILDSILDTAWFIDNKGVFRAVNNAFLSFYNCRPDDVIGKTHFDVIDHETAVSYKQEDDEVIRTCSPKIIESSFQSTTVGTDSLNWLETILTPVLDDNNQCIGIVGVSRDITMRKQHEQKLMLADEVIDASTEAIMVTDRYNKIIRINRAFTALTGYTPREVEGKNPKILRSAKSTNSFYQTMWSQIEKEGHWQGEIWDKRKDGTTYPKWMSISTIRDKVSGDVTNYMAIFSDISEQKKIEKKIRHIAYHDSLTGLANKALLETKLISAIEDAEHENNQIALMQLDLDDFKKINESLGHYVGDELLKAVADVITSCLRTTDLVARLGGDEFIVMLDKVRTIEDIQHLGKNILEKFKDSIAVMNYDLHITPSIGFCIYPQDGENHEVLLQNVDTALYRAKQNGKNQCAFFNKNMTDELLRHLKIEYKLRQALEKNHFVLHYQPQIRMHDKAIVGVEALIRLNSDEGLVSPFEFIPVAEDTGLIVPIGEWVLKQACKDAVRWNKLYPDLNISVAVNISVHQFEPEYLINLTHQTLSETGLPADSLVLELTESTLVTETSVVTNVLKQLKAMGVHLALDDFGTGYSSLSYLKAFDLDYIKIDRSFISGIPDDTNDCSITQAIISMAKSLSMGVIAEGAETQAHIDFLSARDCDKVQGYFYGKPMPYKEFLDFVDNWQQQFTSA